MKEPWIAMLMEKGQSGTILTYCEEGGGSWETSLQSR